MIKIQDPVVKLFSPRLIPSRCSVGIANSKIYIDCSLLTDPKYPPTPQNGCLPLSEVPPCREEGLTCSVALPRPEPGPQGEEDRRADLGSVGKGFSNKTAACVEWGLLVSGVGGARVGAQTLQPSGPCPYGPSAITLLYHVSLEDSTSSR